MLRMSWLVDGWVRLNSFAGKGLFDGFTGFFNAGPGRFAGTLHAPFRGIRASHNACAGGFAGTLHASFGGIRTLLKAFARGLPGAFDLSRRRTMRGFRGWSFWSRLGRYGLLRTRDGRKHPH